MQLLDCSGHHGRWLGVGDCLFGVFKRVGGSPIAGGTDVLNMRLSDVGGVSPIGVRRFSGMLIGWLAGCGYLGD